MSKTALDNRYRILVIDDNPSIHEDFRKILSPPERSNRGLAQLEEAFFAEESGAGEVADSERASVFDVDSAHQGQEGLAMVERSIQERNPYAMAFVDVRMPPGWDGVETVARIWDVAPELQVVICTAYSDYSWREIFRQLGSSDRLLILKKPFDNAEVLQLAHTLTHKWSLNEHVRNRLRDLDERVAQRTVELRTANVRLQEEIAERIQLHEQLRRSQERFVKAFENSPLPMAILAMNEERFVDANHAWLLLLEAERAKLLDQTPGAVCVWEDPLAWRDILRELTAGRPVRGRPAVLRSQTAKRRDVIVFAEPLTLGGEPHVLLLAEDQTERLELEQRLRQSQKMEAVGLLAAGIAHDFNNILTVIQGHVGLQLASAGLDRQMAESLEEVSQASDRAAALTRQLLAFSAKQTMQPRLLDLNRTMSSLRKMLDRLLGEQIELCWQLTPEDTAICADEGGLQQILMNLVVNARDAMPKGGRITISTERVVVEDAASGGQKGEPGVYVRLGVADEGVGMDAGTASRIFEPFFTTKDVGKGTGLGLSTVYGILKQHGGWIEVQSTPQVGSVFQAYLPATRVDPSLPKAGLERSGAAGVEVEVEDLRGNGRVLIAEDERALCELLSQVMQEHGYAVTLAANGREALERWREHGGGFDLLVSDMRMPEGISGQDLAAEFLRERPDLQVILMSGYNSELEGKSLSPDLGVRYLQKPYRSKALLKLARECMQARQGPLAGVIG